MSQNSPQKFDLVEATRQYFCTICELFNNIARTNLACCSACGNQDASFFTVSYTDDDPELDSYTSTKDLGEGD